MTVDAGQPKMALSNLPVAVGVDGTELTPILQGSTLKAATIYQVRAPVVLTFATLPSTPTDGQVYFISDSNLTTFRASISSGGGTGIIPIYYDDTSGTWRAGR